MREGIAAEVVIKALDYYLIPFALFLGATNKEIGDLIALPYLASSVIILFSYRLMRMIGSRLKIVLLCAFAQTFVLFPLVILPVFRGYRATITALIFFIVIFRALGTVIGASWGSLVSHYLKDNERGKFFGCRSHVTGVSGLAIAGLFGAWLHLTEQKNFQVTGFAILFLAVAMSRFISVLIIRKMKDISIPNPQRPQKAMRKFTLPFWHLINLSKDSNFLKFLIYVSLTTFAAQFSLPFFSVWLWKSLGLNYIWYTAIHLSSILMGLIFFPLWGRHADLVGNVRILRQTSWVIALIPLLWVFVRNPAALIFVEFLSGIVWAGFNLSSTNYIYDCCSPFERVQCLVAFHFITCVFSFLGAFLGGNLLQYLPAIMGYQMASLFVISAILRLIADTVISGKFAEIRQKVKKVSSWDLFLSVIGLRPIAGSETTWEENY